MFRAHADGHLCLKADDARNLKHAAQRGGKAGHEIGARRRGPKKKYLREQNPDMREFDSDQVNSRNRVSPRGGGVDED